MPEFTPEQARVIAHERGNLLVSAAAGSGTAPRQGARVLSASRRRTRAPPRAASGTSARRGAQKSGRRLMGSALLSLFHFT